MALLVSAMLIMEFVCVSLIEKARKSKTKNPNDTNVAGVLFFSAIAKK